MERNSDSKVSALKIRLEVNKRDFRPGHKYILDAMFALRKEYERLRMYSEALTVAQEILQCLILRKDDVDHPRVTDCKVAIVRIYWNLEMYQEAKILSIEILGSYKRVSAPIPENPIIHATMESIGVFQTKLGLYNSATQIYQEVLALRREILTADDPSISICMFNLTGAYIQLDMLTEAFVLVMEVIEFFRRIFCSHNLKLADLYEESEISYRPVGIYDFPLANCREVLKVLSRILPNDYPDLAFSIYAVSALYCHYNRFNEAVVVCTEALAYQRRILPSDDPDIACSINSLAFLYNASKLHEEAIRLGREELELHRRIHPPFHINVVIAMANLACYYRSVGLNEDALNLHSHAITQLRRVLHSDHNYVTCLVKTLSKFCFTLGLRPDPYFQMGCEPGNHDADRVCFNPRCNIPLTQDCYLVCSKCQRVCYCSTECQVAHWMSGHKEACTENKIQQGLSQLDTNG